MTLSRVSYSYKAPEWASYDIDIDPNLDPVEQEQFVIADIRETYPDLEDIEIEKIEVIS